VNASDNLDPLARDPEEDEGLLYAGEEDSLALFEWSAPPGCAISDRDGWAAANPALGHTISERTIAAAARTDPEWVFRTEVLCQWSEGTLEGPFPPGAWEACADPNSTRAPGSPISLGIDTSWDRATTYVALAATRPDGLAHVEIVARRAGTEWLPAWLTSPERSPEIRGAVVAAQAKGAPVSSLLPMLRDAKVNVLEWGGAALGQGTGDLYDRVRAAVGEGTGDVRQLRHRSQPVLNLAAATAATRPVGDAWLWDRRRSPADASPLIAVTAALWALNQKPRTSAYESRRLEVL
jgi:hypothetical protein